MRNDDEGWVPASLEQVRERLLEELGRESKFHFINTRLILVTGLNLNEIVPNENYDQACIGRVIAELNAMGFLKAPPARRGG